MSQERRQIRDGTRGWPVGLGGTRVAGAEAGGGAAADVELVRRKDAAHGRRHRRRRLQSPLSPLGPSLPLSRDGYVGLAGVGVVELLVAVEEGPEGGVELGQLRLLELGLGVPQEVGRDRLRRPARAPAIPQRDSPTSSSLGRKGERVDGRVRVQLVVLRRSFRAQRCILLGRQARECLDHMRPAISAELGILRSRGLWDTWFWTGRSWSL